MSETLHCLILTRETRPLFSHWLLITTYSLNVSGIQTNNDAAEVTTSQQASSSSSSVAVCGLTHDLFIMKQSGRLQTSFVLSVIQKIPNKNKNGVTW